MSAWEWDEVDQAWLDKHLVEDRSHPNHIASVAWWREKIRDALAELQRVGTAPNGQPWPERYRELYRKWAIELDRVEGLHGEIGRLRAELQRRDELLQQIGLRVRDHSADTDYVMTGVDWPVLLKAIEHVQSATPPTPAPVAADHDEGTRAGLGGAQAEAYVAEALARPVEFATPPAPAPLVSRCFCGLPYGHRSVCDPDPIREETLADELDEIERIEAAPAPAAEPTDGERAIREAQALIANGRALLDAAWKTLDGERPAVGLGSERAARDARGRE